MKAESLSFPETSTDTSFGNTSTSNSTSSEFWTDTTFCPISDTQSVQATQPTVKKKLRLKSEFQQYHLVELVGRGAFGEVFKAVRVDCSERVFAIKRLPMSHDKPNREVELSSSLDHPNCIRVLHHFEEICADRRFVNLVMDYFPYTLSQMVTLLANSPLYKQFCLKGYAWQLCEAVRYLHSRHICHRDIKPQNILLTFDCRRLVLSDFGSAKVISSIQKQSTAYVCSRFYRAPELLMGEEHYGLQTDMWSVGCVLAELVLGKSVFEGKNSKDQFVKIMVVLGSPDERDLAQTCPNIKVQIPFVKGVGLANVLGDCDPLLLDLISQLLVINPKKRLSAEAALSHQFFAERNRPDSPKLVCGNLIDALRVN